MTQHSKSRRTFIKQAGTAALAVSSSAAFANIIMPQPKKLGIALVGLGYYSRDLLAPALQLTQHCELRGIVTGSPDKIPAWQKQYGIKDANVYNYQNMHDMANNDDIDVIYIVVPTGLHSMYSAIAANIGKHVWCEKPMAKTVEECQSIISACQKNKVKLSIGYRMQHEPNTQTLIRWRSDKPYGKIQSLSAKAGYGGSYTEKTDNWRFNERLGGGALYDMGVYPINAIRYATGMDPIRVLEARQSTNHPQVFDEVDETTAFKLEFPEGIIADCFASVGQGINRLQINCEKGNYGLTPFQAYSGITGFTSDNEWPQKEVANQQAQQMDDDALAIMNNSKVMVPGENAIMDIRIVQAVREAVRTRQEVQI